MSNLGITHRMGHLIGLSDRLACRCASDDDILVAKRCFKSFQRPHIALGDLIYRLRVDCVGSETRQIFRYRGYRSDLSEKINAFRHRS